MTTQNQKTIADVKDTRQAKIVGIAGKKEAETGLILATPIYSNIKKTDNASAVSQEVVEIFNAVAKSEPEGNIITGKDGRSIKLANNDPTSEDIARFQEGLSNKAGLVQATAMLFRWCYKREQFTLYRAPLKKIIQEAGAIKRVRKQHLEKASEAIVLLGGVTLKKDRKYGVGNNGKKYRVRGVFEEWQALLSLSGGGLEWDAKKKVIRNITGELLPNIDPAERVRMRGTIYPDGFFKLPADNEGGRVLFASDILLRFAQRTDATIKGEPTTWARGEVVERLGYTLTDKQNPWVCSEKIKGTLDKLTALGIIGEWKIDGKIVAKVPTQDVKIQLVPPRSLIKSYTSETQRKIAEAKSLSDRKERVRNAITALTNEASNQERLQERIDRALECGLNRAVEIVCNEKPLKDNEIEPLYQEFVIGGKNGVGV